MLKALILYVISNYPINLIPKLECRVTNDYEFNRREYFYKRLLIGAKVINTNSFSKK